VRIQAKRRPPTRRHLHKTTDAAESFEDKTVLIEAASCTAENGRQTDADDVVHSSSHVPITRQLDLPDGDKLGPSLVVDAVDSHNKRRYSDDSAAEAVSSARSDSIVTVPVDNTISSAIPADTFSSPSKTQALKPSPDIDDIFADSSLFAACEYFWVCILCALLTSVYKPSSIFYYGCTRYYFKLAGAGPGRI